MAYVVPSVLVYQQLASNAGVANVTPDLDACIVGPCFNVVGYVAGSVASLTLNRAVTSTGAPATLSNNAITNTFYLGSTKVGQLVTSSSVQVYLNSALVETKVARMTGTAGSNILTYATYTGTGDATSGSATLANVTSPTQLNVGDIVSVAGAGPAAAALVSTIVSVSGSNITLADQAGTSATGAAITRTSFNNLNSTTSTLRVEAGDAVSITYGSTVFTTQVLSLTATGNTVTEIKTVDVLPVGVTPPLTVSVQKAFNNLLLPASYNSNTNYTATNVTVDGSVVINPLPKVSYGTVVSGNVHIPYTALRTDLSGSVLDIANDDDREGVLGEATENNPLGLAVQLALANTTGRIRAIAINSDDLAGYLGALDLAESSKLYAMVPLTQSVDILGAFKVHVEAMSTPENAAWRVTLVNTAIPSVTYIGQYSPSLVNSNGGNNAVALVSSDYVLTSSNSQFVTDGVVPGDVVKITSHAVTSQVVTSVTVTTVLSNQQLVVNSPIALTAVNFYVQRTLTKSQQADAVAAASTSFGSSRVIHVQPDLVGVTVDGVTKYLPGYYLCAAMSGLVSGLPSQQSLTNIGLAGIADLKRSNFYFTRAQLSTISAAGTCLVVQESPGTLPYFRHSITTDMTVLQYRELSVVKDIDFLSYFFHDILKGMIGKYNIVPETLQILRTTIIAGAELLKSKKLPKIGAPLVSYQIKTLKQDPVNKDQVIVEMPVELPFPMNYVNLYLIY
jgi:hypothetical protein